MERAKDFVKKWLTEEEISGRKLNITYAAMIRRIT